MPFSSMISGVSRPYELPPHLSGGVEAVANISPVDEALGGGGRGRASALVKQAYRAATPEPERAPAVHARDLMSTPVKTLPEDASVSVARALIRLRGFRHVPVVSPHGEPIGMLSDRDLFGESAEPGNLVRDVMQTELLVATPDTHVRELARVMVHARIGALPIIDDERKVQGIVTTTDLLRAIVNEAPIDLWT